MQEQLHLALTEARSSLRFRWHGMAVAWAACLLGWAWVVKQPDVYESNARVFVDTSSVLQPVLGSQIIRPDVEAQINYIREALLGRQQLERVAAAAGLDAGAVSAADREDVINGLRNTLQIRSSSEGNSANGIYSISYRHRDRDTSVSVVTQLLNAFVEDTLGENQRGSDTAERFLDERVREYETRLELAEEALASFKRTNAERLPGAEGGYFARMQAERDALTAANRELRLMQSRRDQLLEQLSGEAAVVAGANGALPEPAPNSIDARIRDYQARLDEILLQYTERHPDVIGLRETLARLTEQRQQQLAELGLDPQDQELAALDVNPVFQATRIALLEVEVDIAALESDIGERTLRVEELQGLIGEVPEVEAQLARLNRDYDVIYQQYLSLVRSRETQELSQKADDTDQVQFRIIDPPMAGFAPVAPMRLSQLALVLAVGLGLGVAVCVGLSQAFPVVSTPRTLREIVALPVFGVISQAWEMRNRQRRRHAIQLYTLAASALFAICGALIGIEVLGPGVHELWKG